VTSVPSSADERSIDDDRAAMSDDATGFHSLQLDARILRAVEELGFAAPTPIQIEATPAIMEGRDLLGGARTGSGKTAAFGLAMLHRLRDAKGAARALVLVPTRELAIQVADALDSFAKYLPLKILTVYGGVGYREQLRGLKAGAQIVVGTPGRVLDHMTSGALDLSDLEMLVLDEADEMLQMGFLDDVEKVLKAAPEGRQIALFSATMPAQISRIATRYLREPVRVQIEGKGLNASHVAQRWIKVTRSDKARALARLLRAEERDATLVFARTRAGVATLTQELIALGFSADGLHGDLNQGARELVLGRLRARQVEIVVATDVAARGLDVDHITHVINYELPESAETYVHRVGRTARAGRDGWAISLVSPAEMPKLRQMERGLGTPIEQMSLPSQAQVLNVQRGSLRREIEAAAQAEPTPSAYALLDELIASGLSAREVAAATLSMLAGARSIDLDAPIQAEAPREELPRGDFSGVNEVALVFPVGRQDGYRPADFVGGLCNETGLTSRHIGRVKLGDRVTYVGLPRQVALDIIESHGSIELRGERHKLELASSEELDVQEPQHKNQRGGGAKPHAKPAGGKRPFGPKKPHPIRAKAAKKPAKKR
jgi:ATP-dependent RNA helicase DeaD